MLAQALVDRNPLAMVPVGGEDEDGEQLMVYNPVYGASNVSFAVRFFFFTTLKPRVITISSLRWSPWQRVLRGEERENIYQTYDVGP